MGHNTFLFQKHFAAISGLQKNVEPATINNFKGFKICM